MEAQSLNLILCITEAVYFLAVWWSRHIYYLSNQMGLCRKSVTIFKMCYEVNRMKFHFQQIIGLSLQFLGNLNYL